MKNKLYKVGMTGFNDYLNIPLKLKQITQWDNKGGGDCFIVEAMKDSFNPSDIKAGHLFYVGGFMMSIWFKPLNLTDNRLKKIEID